MLRKDRSNIDSSLDGGNVNVAFEGRGENVYYTRDRDKDGDKATEKDIVTEVKDKERQTVATPTEIDAPNSPLVRPMSAFPDSYTRKERMKILYICLVVFFALLLIAAAIATYLLQKETRPDIADFLSTHAPLSTSTPSQTGPDRPSTGAAQLSPASLWPPASQSNSILGVYRSGAVASDGAACSTVGKDLLVDGGSAVDAMIGVALCNGLANMHSMGIGGGFFLTYYNATSGQSFAVDAREVAPAKAQEKLTDRSLSYSGGLAIAVPGEVNGYWEAHQRFGRLPWSSLFAPAIKMASDGIRISHETAKAINVTIPRVEKRNLNLRELIFNEEENRFYREGDLFKNEKLAAVLRAVSEEGPDAFYNGSLTSTILREIQTLGGIIDRDDFLNYTAKVKEPIRYRLRNGWLLIGPPPPSSSAIVALIINMLEGFGTDDAIFTDEGALLLALHRYSEVMKFGFARRSLLGDSDYVDVREIVKNLTSHGYGDRLRSLITNSTHEPSFYGAADEVSPFGTSHNCVLSPDGDAASLTSTINSYFGAKVFGQETGIIYNNEMDDFSIPRTSDSYGIFPSPYNTIQAGKKPMSSQSPIIIIDDRGKVRLIVGASGGSKIVTATANVIWNNVLLGLDLKTSVDLPRLHHQLFPNLLEYESFAPEKVMEKLNLTYGHELKRNTRRSGVVQAIAVDENDAIYANCDFRKGGAPDGF